MTTEHTEIGTKLVLDDAASATMAKIRHGMGEVGHAVQEAQNEMRSLAKQAIATAIGFQFDHGIESVKELGAEAYNAATGAMAQQKALAGVLAMIDRSGASYEDLRDVSVGLHDELEQVGIKAGVATDQVIDSFSMIAERSEKTREEVFALTEQMTIAGKAMPGGVEQIASAFRDLETGIIRPKNAIVLMMKQMGVVGGTAKQIAKGMSALMQGGEAGQKKAFDLAEKAIARMSEKMKNAPASFAGLVQSLKDVRENIYEAVGIPMLNALVPSLDKLKKYFVDHREEIEHWASVVGKQVGDWMVEAAENFRKGFEFVQNHAEEIKSALTAGAAAFKDALEFMVAHRAILTAISAARLAGSAAGAAGGLGSAAGAVGSIGAGRLAAQTVAAGLTAEEGAGLAAAGVFGGVGAGTVAVATAGIAGLAAGIGGLGYAAYTAYKFATDAQGEEARWARLRQAAMEGDAASAARMKEALGNLDLEMTQVANHLVMVAELNASITSKAMKESFAAYQGMGDDEGFTNLDVIAQNYEEASKRNDEKTMKYIKSLLEGDAAIQDGFFFLTEKGVSGAKLLQKEFTGVDFALSNTVKDAIKTIEARGVSPTSLSFPNATFYIKQDFKDQDPGQVVAMFRSDLVKHATRPMSSQFSDVFGM